MAGISSQLFSAIGNVNLACTSASSRATLVTSGSPLPGVIARLRNEGSVAVFFKMGTSSVTAATTDVPISAGDTMIVPIGSADTHIAGITTSSTATVRVESGYGGVG